MFLRNGELEEFTRLEEFKNKCLPLSLSPLIKSETLLAHALFIKGHPIGVKYYA